MRVKNELPRLPLGSRVEIIREGFSLPLGSIGTLRTITDEGEGGSDVYYVTVTGREAYDLPPFAVRLKPYR